MAEPALRRMDRNLPRLEMRSPAFVARQRERLGDISREKQAALDAIREEARRIVAAAQAEAVAIVDAALADARRQVAAMAHEAAKARGGAPLDLPERRIVADIIRAAAARHGVPASRIVGRGNARDIVHARWEAIAEAYLARPDLSLPVLGRLFGGRDHTTILHALRRMGVYQGRGR